jgi:glycolate oxidase iron-sulfur subunit
MELRHLEGLWRCSKCGACTAVCPLYQQTTYEGMAARGKLALLEAAVDNGLDPSKGLRARLEDCLLCGACAANCPSLVPTTALFLEGRAALARTLGMPLPVRGMLAALASPGLQAAGMPWVGLLRQAGAFPLMGAVPAGLVPEPIRAAVRAAPPIAIRPFRSRPVPAPPVGQPLRGTVAYFAGCIMNWGYPDVAQATCRALAATGYRVEVPAVQCCGMPHRVYGDEDTARRLARRNLEALEGFEAVITDCASCGAALKSYGELLGEEAALAEHAQAVAARVLDISQFLARHGLPALREGTPLRVTYHEPCHLGREQGVKAEPRQLLRALPGVEYVEMTGADVCCGGAGSFCITHASLSQRIGEAKTASILATGASVVASGCPSCIGQLSAMLRGRGPGVRVCHPLELLAERLGASHPEGLPEGPPPI